MRVANDADRNGTEMKRGLIDALRGQDVDCTDLDYPGWHPEEDHPDVAHHLAARIQKSDGPA